MREITNILYSSIWSFKNEFWITEALIIVNSHQKIGVVCSVSSSFSRGQLPFVYWYQWHGNLCYYTYICMCACEERTSCVYLYICMYLHMYEHLCISASCDTVMSDNFFISESIHIDIVRICSCPLCTR